MYINLTFVEESRKKRHPFYRIMELPETELKAKIATMNREDIIEWLQWNDPNGIYTDKDSLKEFDHVMSREQGEEIMLRQILEG